MWDSQMGLIKVEQYFFDFIIIMYKKILLLFFIYNFLQCSEYDCKKNLKEDVDNECIIILEKGLKRSMNMPYLEPEGINPETGEYCKCVDKGVMWGFYEDYMEKGDTFVKRKGESFFTIHKKDTIFRIDLGDCDKDNQFIIPTNNPPQDYNKVKRH